MEHLMHQSSQPNASQDVIGYSVPYQQLIVSSHFDTTNRSQEARHIGTPQHGVDKRLDGAGRNGERLRLHSRNCHTAHYTQPNRRRGFHQRQCISSED